MQSMLHQSYNNYNIFICFDGNVDSNVEKLLTVLSGKHSNIKISKNLANRGLAYSLNRLIELILVDHPYINYIARMDADDVCSLSRLTKQVAFLNKNPHVDVLGAFCQEFGIYYKTITKYVDDNEIKASILKLTPFVHPSVIFQRRVFEQGYRYPLHTSLSEDLALWLILSADGFHFHNYPEVLLYYRLTEMTLKRRGGRKKALSELSERWSYLIKTKATFLPNIFYIAGHFIIRLMPISVVKKLYKLLR